MKHAARREFERWAASYDRSILQRFVFEPSYRALFEELVLWHRGDDRVGVEVDHEGGDAGRDARLTGRGSGGGRDDRPFSLLDVGSGTGTWLARVASTPLPLRRGVGLDYSEGMCRQASEKAAGCDHGLVNFVHGDSEHLPFSDAAFDVVTCSNSFHHYPHQESVVTEFRRVLRPGGRLIIIDGFRDNLIGWVVFDVLVARAEGAVHHVPWSRMRRMCLDAGFWSVRQRKINVWIPLLVTVAMT